MIYEGWRQRMIWAIIFGLGQVLGQTWCGKNYLPDQPVIPPGDAFHIPPITTTPHLALRCTPRIKPYLEADASNPASMLVDTTLTFLQLPDAVLLQQPFELDDRLRVVVSVEEEEMAWADVQVNASSVEIPFSLSRLVPWKAPYNVVCKAYAPSGQEFRSHSLLSYLPNPSFGSVTKMDHKTGALLVRIPGGDGVYKPVFLIGFYTSFGGYLASNLSILDEVKRQGFNTVHPVPPFDDVIAFTQVLDRMEELGLYLMYDMRHSYQNSQLMLEELNMIKHRSNLLWYTADEPDGPGDPLDATKTAYDLIYDNDGYHPVSIALNCADYRFSAYVSGADIILPDVYMISNDVKFSSRYNTSCTADFGCCGCDNCQGRFEDISERLDNAHLRMQHFGWEKTKTVWTVTQAFGGEEFWIRAPTGREWLVQAILSVNHGARGIIPWIYPAPADIIDAASSLAAILPSASRFIFDSSAVVEHLTSKRVDLTSWSLYDETLVLVTNLDDHDSSLLLPPTAAYPGKTIDWLLIEGVSAILSFGTGWELLLEPLGSSIFVMRNEADPDKGRHDEL